MKKRGKRRKPTEDEIRQWCEEHDCHFYRMGCPEDWTRTDVFRVGVVGGTAWACYGATVPVKTVVDWLNDPPQHYEI